MASPYLVPLSHDPLRIQRRDEETVTGWKNSLIECGSQTEKALHKRIEIASLM